MKVGIYKLGDWAVNSFKGNEYFFKVNNPHFIDGFNIFNKVTEPWKIMLLELGRETPDFKPGDVIVTHQDVYVAGYHDHDEIVLLFEENLVIRFCPEEHSIEV